MNKNIFAAFGMDETEVAHVAIDPITCSGSKTTPDETNSASNDDEWETVKRKERKPTPKSTPKSKTLYTPKSTPKATPKATPDASPLVLKLEEFPALDTQLTKAQEKAISAQNKARFAATKEKIKEAEYVDPRSASFAAMADKKKVAASLTCTKACRIVTGPYTNPAEGKEPAFGVCTREVCTFAHSDEELQLPVCGFDGNCRFLNGKRDRKTRKIIPGTQCRFRHSSESADEYYKRSKVERPALPPTSENTRKPRAASASTSKVSTAKTVTHSPGKYSSMPPPAPVNRSRRTKSRWDEKPVETTVETKVESKAEPKVEPRSSRRYRSYSSSDDSSSSESSSDDSSSSESSSDDSSSSESEGEYRSRKRRERRRSPVKSSRSRSKSNSKTATAQIIRVPTKELAAVAIKAAFDRGQYNVQVLVEGC